ncbi:SGNH/GDSL hydrolase family protein [Stieleria sp. JC731]|uniref:SGNH/GDSL hydrolase family protein n=1 Tax=Pirellulaceae TaxID=2691357 RepID=UPI001E468D95|nr:SGNH/GDSL hydrolase family protein [Stieleria sp. JC731]MCC9601474.1 SGNH/GDSL hydrolase family protein [Stieleria sp. JC731]
MIRCFLFSLAVFVSVSAVSAQATYSRLVVFGDSLCDTGNSYAATGIPPGGAAGFPYFQGRFCNGPNWIDYLQVDLSLADPQVLNFAVGGSSTGFGYQAPPDGIFQGPPGLLVPTVGVQIQTYQLLAIPDPDQLTVLWAGSNDLLTMKSPSSAVSNIEQHIRDLAAMGADEFLVPSMSALGEAPAVEGWLERLVMNYLSLRFNYLLNKRLDSLESELSIEVHRLNTFNLTMLGLAIPQLFGFTNTTDAALDDIAAGEISPAEGASYFYWDVIHPTTLVHSVLAQAASDELD